MQLLSPLPQSSTAKTCLKYYLEVMKVSEQGIQHLFTLRHYSAAKTWFNYSVKVIQTMQQGPKVNQSQSLLQYSPFCNSKKLTESSFNVLQTLRPWVKKIKFTLTWSIIVEFGWVSSKKEKSLNDEWDLINLSKKNIGSHYLYLYLLYISSLCCTMQSRTQLGRVI